MGLLIRFIVFLVDAAIAVYVLVATVSLLGGFVCFLIQAPGAIRSDLERWGREHAAPPRLIRYVPNDAEDYASVLPPPPVLPPPRDPSADGGT